LWIAQPGLSTQIRRLEAELGVKLFNRHTRGVDLTPAGELFLERARAALLAAELAGATGRDLEAGVVGTVRLGLSTGPRWRQTAAFLVRFTREYSGIELTVLEGYGGTLWRDLRDGRLDAVVAPANFASADLRGLDLGAEPWVVLVGRSHRLAGVGPLAAEDLIGEQIAVTAHRDGAGYDRAVADVLSDLGVVATLVRSAPGPGSQSAVADGNVLALTTASEAFNAEVIARPLDPARGLAFELLWRDETPSLALSELIRVAAESVERGPSDPHLLAVVA
jgi:DNA-binding transcriptional LysR family regulator